MLRAITNLFIIYLTIVLTGAFIHWATPIWNVGEWTAGQRWLLLIGLSIWVLIELTRIGKKYRQDSEPDIYRVWHRAEVPPNFPNRDLIVMDDKGDIWKARYVKGDTNEGYYSYTRGRWVESPAKWSYHFE